MNKSQAVIACADLAKTYCEGKLCVEVLHGINLQVDAGAMVAIIGPSGSGKSTLLHLLGGLDKPSSGKVVISGTDINSLSETEKGKLRNQNLGFVYQFHHLLPEFTALENVCMPLLLRNGELRQIEQDAKDMLALVGLKQRVEHRVAELSGGERQRVAIARALVTKPKCVLADEPTGNLDHKTAMQVYDLITSLNRELQTAFVIVTHDFSIAKKMQRILSLDDGVLKLLSQEV
ncbi:MAG: lipoprotein-releasing ABC transporter ATP-binding protein LolD [Gammaproteobacteria bacterium]|nr:lipoprotein-releasing ABC transporter ATP-binding protein LolD [Gammaproteobacteria bacterium]